MIDERDQVSLDVVVNAPVASVWSTWTTSQGAETFFAEKANIDLRIGGPYEIFFNPSDDRMSTKGHKVLSYRPQRMLSFSWNLPLDEFPELKNEFTWVVIDLTALQSSRTHVGIAQLGFKQGISWERAAQHMRQGWSELAQRLQARFNSGPIDWARHKMMWHERVSRGSAE